jgi:3-deoxy-D-manno-octulosonic acid kinase
MPSINYYRQKQITIMMLNKLMIPPSFSLVKKGNTSLFIKEGYKDIILNTVFGTESSQMPNKNKDVTNVKFGRGRYLSIPVTKKIMQQHNHKKTLVEAHRDKGLPPLYQDGIIEMLIVRDYKHGGLLGKLFGSYFCNGNRPLHELYLNEIAFQKGVPCAEVIAITKKKVWGIFYKSTFISKEISGADDLIQFLQKSSLEYLQRMKKSIMSALARSIRKMHDCGIYHADLHLKNILVKKDSNGRFQIYIIDLDKSVIFDKLNVGQRIKNLIRLDRSLEKLRWLLTGTTDKFQRYTGGGEITTPLQRDSSEGKKNELPGENSPFTVPASQTTITGKETAHAHMSEKINLISRADRVRFFKTYMLYNQPLGKDWKRYIRQYYSSHSTHKFWWRVLEKFSK